MVSFLQSLLLLFCRPTGVIQNYDLYTTQATKLQSCHPRGVINKTTTFTPLRQQNYKLDATQATKLPACRPTGVIASLHNDDDDGNENGKKEIGLDKQKNNFAPTSRFFFFYISLPSLHNYNVKLRNFTFCGGREQKKTTFFLLF